MMTTEPNLYISIDDDRWNFHRLALKKLSAIAIDAAWNAIKKSNAPPIFVSISFTNNRTIKKINKQTRGFDKPTNILSFQNFESVSDLPKLSKNMPAVPVGDLIIAYETIFAEAMAENKKPKDHLTHLLVHGFLHLFGYDHMNEKDAQKMEGLEIKILKTLGIPNPYL